MKCWTHDQAEPCEPCIKATVRECGLIVKNWKGRGGTTLLRPAIASPRPTVGPGTEPVQETMEL